MGSNPDSDGSFLLVSVVKKARKTARCMHSEIKQRRSVDSSELQRTEWQRMRRALKSGEDEMVMILTIT